MVSEPLDHPAKPAMPVAKPSVPAESRVKEEETLTTTAPQPRSQKGTTEGWHLVLAKVVVGTDARVERQYDNTGGCRVTKVGLRQQTKVQGRVGAPGEVKAAYIGGPGRMAAMRAF